MANGQRAVAVAAACVLLCAAPASAADPVAEWHLNEGSGTVATDSGAHHLDGALAGPPSWIAGVEGTALRFDGNGDVELPDDPAFEPARITVAAWVRSSGSPGKFRYVFSKGASTCLRGSYGLYTGDTGGAAFYAAGNGLFTLSPQVSPSAIWDGRWHRLTGGYDGARVRLYLDGVQVGSGTPGPTNIEYGLSSRAPFIGTYRSNCELPFIGDIDDVTIWQSELTIEETMADAKAPPETPSSGPIGRAPGQNGAVAAVKGRRTTPAGCTSIALSRRSVRAGRTTGLVATVRRGGARVKGARVLLKAHKLRISTRSDARGHARFRVRPSTKAKRLRIAVATKRAANCGFPVAFVRVRPRQP
jgi:hypothetical protein